jgi:hypothetical protein
MPWPSVSSLSKKKKTDRSDHWQLRSSQKRPDSLNSPDNLKTEALLAFRTITTMLSLLQTTIGNDTSGKELNSANSRKSLAVLNALAAVVTREHGVAAVVSNLTSENTEVVISIIPDREPLTISQLPSGSVAQEFMGLVFRFWTTQNPRYLMPATDLNISDPEAAAPKQLKKKQFASDGNKLLVAFLMNYW